MDNAVYVYTYKPSELTWRRIVFLPFNFYWRIFIAITGITFCNLVIFEEVFLMDSFHNIRLHKVMTFMTILYSVDFVLSLLHRIWEAVQKSMPYQPKPLLVLVVDLISILPISSLFKERLLNKQGKIYWPKVWALNGCLRMYQVFVELLHLQQRMGLNPIFICLIQHNALILCLSSLFSCVWYIIGNIYMDRGETWLSDLIKSNSYLDMDSPYIAYAVSFLHIFVLMNNTFVFDIKPVTRIESLFCLSMSYLGFLLRYCFAVAIMVSSFLKYRRHTYVTRDHITINLMLSSPEDKKAIEDYYVTYWNNWVCLQKCPLLDIVPLCLKKDILTDLYWEAIEHSHLLRHFTMSVKRQLSTQMQSKFMQPGDYIFKKGEVRSSYYYIASGVVQVMSFYDGISPIITISAGSCLGCFALEIPSVSRTDVICATECEVRFLTYKRYFTVLAQYTDASKLSRKTFMEHIAHVKLIYALSKVWDQQHPMLKLYGVPQEDKLKWIKRRWRTINEVDLTELKSDGFLYKLESTVLPLNADHTSKYLDLLVLSTEMKFNADKCCYDTSFPYVLEPNCNFIRIWHLFIVVVITLDSLIVVYSTAFLPYVPDSFNRWSYIMCYAYLFDAYLQVITAVRTVEKTITQPNALLRYHLKDLVFILDIFGTLPIYQFMLLKTNEDEGPKNIIVLHRLFKLVRVYTYFKYQASRITSKTSVTLVLKSVYLFTMITLISACTAFIMSCRFQDKILNCTPDSWFDRYTKSTKLNLDSIYSYIIPSIIYVGELILICGVNSQVSVMLPDACFSALIVFISKNIATFTFSEFMATWTMKRRKKLTCEELITSLRRILQMKNLHKGLIDIVTQYLRLQWKANAAVDQVLDGIPLKQIYSPILRNRRHKRLTKFLRTVPFFNELDSDTFTKAYRLMNMYTVPEGYIFCRSGEMPTTFNILLQGSCITTSMLKEDILEFPYGKLLKSGDFFPLMEILQNIECLQLTESVTTCEVASIDAYKLKELLFENKFLVLCIKLSIAVPPNQLDVVISKKRYRNTKNHKPYFIKLQQKTTSYQEPSKCAHLLKPFRVLFNSGYVINPVGNLIYIWETIKVLQVILTVIYTPSMLLFICSVTNLKYIFAIFLDLISVADIFVRFNLGVIKTNGIIIKNTMYYLSHSFTVDLISTIPMYIILNDYNLTTVLYGTVFCKLWQMYRIMGYIIAIKNKFGFGDFSLTVSLFTIYLILFVFTLALCIVSLTCNIQCVNGIQIMKCFKPSWIYADIIDELDNPIKVMVFSYYICLAVVTGTETGPFNVSLLEEANYLVLLTVISCIVKCLYLPSASAQLIGSHSRFAKHRDCIRNLRLFIKNEGGDATIADTIIEHHVFNYTKLRGLEMQTVLNGLHPSLQTDISYALYFKSTTCLQRFISDPACFIKTLSCELKELHYLKDTTILDIDEVNRRIYFISDGIISVINKELETVRILLPGSMFGALNANQRVRHKFKYLSQINTCLVCIEFNKFFRLFRLWNRVEMNLFIKMVSQREFVSAVLSTQTTAVEIPLILTKSHSILYKGSSFYQVVMFFLSMVIPYLTMYPLLICIVFKYIGSFICVLYMFDLLMSFRILIELHATYNDKATGICITNKRRIRRAYLSNPFGFLLDLLSLFPFEVIWYAISGKWVNELRLNRILRAIMMVAYTVEFKETAYVRHWMRWFSFFTHVTMVPFLVTLFWSFVTCQGGCRTENGTILKNPFDSFVFALNEIIIAITFTSSNSFYKPTTITNCLILTICVSVIFIIFPFLIAEFTQKYNMSDYTKKMYEYKLYCVKLYLQLRDLSNSLLQQLWNYSLLLWVTNRGEYLPKYLLTAPSNLRCHLMYDLYGGHLAYNILFEDCETAFIFQLSGRLKRTVYFPGDVIIRKFDVDTSMYFINSGEVEAIQFDDLNMELVEEIYITGQCFGLVQGLHRRLPHSITYKARNTVELLSLRHDDYEDLLSAFPNDKKRIYERAQNIIEMDIR